MFFFYMKAQEELVSAFDADLKKIINSVHFSTQHFSEKRGADAEALSRFIEEARHNKGVKEVSVISSQEQVVASSNPKKIGQPATITGKEILVREEFGSRDSSHKATRYDISVPIMHEKKVIGLVQTAIYLNDFHDELQRISIRYLSLFLGAFLFTFLITAIVLRQLSKPLRDLATAAQQVSGGDMNVRLPAGSHDEVGRLTVSFNSMVEQVGKLKEMEEKLRLMERKAVLAEAASTIAHEIRNPLNLINLTTDHLGHQYQPLDPTARLEFQELISSLKTQVQHMNKMVSDYLLVGRPMKLARTEGSLLAAILQVEKLVKQRLVQKGVLFEKNIPESFDLKVDFEQMRLVFLNLFLNAVAAVEVGGRIAIHATQDEKQFRIAIEDNGHGVPAQNLEQIFEPYFTNRQDGTGLGLTLSRRIVEDHGGILRAYHRPSGGTGFEILLPKGVNG